MKALPQFPIKAFNILPLTLLVVTTIIPSSNPAYSQLNTPQKVVLGLGPLEAVAFHPLESQMATVSPLGIFLWDAESGEVVTHFEVPMESVRSICFSPDGKHLLTGEELWDIETGQIIHTYSKEYHSITSAAFSPAGDRILTGGADGVAIVWDVDSEKEICRFSEHAAPINTVAFSKDGKKAITGSSDLMACVWETETAREIYWLTWHTDSVVAAAVSPDGKWLLTGSYDNTAILWGLESGEVIHVFENNKSAVLSVAFSPDGQLAATGGVNGTIRIWDVRTGNEINTLNDGGRINDVAFSRDGRRLFSRINNELVKMWDIESQSQIQAYYGHVSAVISSAFIPDTDFLLTGGSYPGPIYIWDTNTGEIVREFSIQSYTSIECLAVSPDGRSCLIGNPSKKILQMDLETGETIFTFDEKYGIIQSLDFSPNGRKALAVYSGHAEVWDLTTQKLLYTVYPNEVTPDNYETEEYDYMEFFSGGMFFPTSNIALVTGGGAFLWDTETGDVIQTFSDRGWEGNLFAISPNGETAVKAFSENNTLASVDVDSGDIVWQKELPFESNFAMTVAFSPDGKIIALGSGKYANRTARDGLISLWEAKTGNLIQEHPLLDEVNMHGDAPNITHLDFSPDGNHMAVECNDGTVRIFQTNYLMQNTASVRDFSIYE